MNTRTRIARHASLVGLLAVAGLALPSCDPVTPIEPDGAPDAAAFGKAPPAPTAEIEVLPALNDLGAEPSDITDAGVVVGRSAFTLSPALVHHAVRWTRPNGSPDWQIEDLHGRLPSPQESQANKANEHGLIIGYMEIGGVSRGFVLPATGPAIDLGPSVYASDLSSSDEITGYRSPTFRRLRCRRAAVLGRARGGRGAAAATGSRTVGRSAPLRAGRRNFRRRKRRGWPVDGSVDSRSGQLVCRAAAAIRAEGTAPSRHERGRAGDRIRLPVTRHL